MNAMKPLLLGVGCVFALAAALPSEAASIQKPGSSGHWRGGGGGHGSGGNWSGRGNGGHWSGGHGHYHGYRGYGYGYRGYYPWWGFYAAAPFVFGAYYSSWDPYWGYWGPRSYPYAYDQAYPRYYQDDPRAAMPRPGDQDLGPAPNPVDPTAPGAPTQGPLYMNYCASAKAYYPKVTSCPEGWVFQRPKYD